MSLSKFEENSFINCCRFNLMAFFFTYLQFNLYYNFVLCLKRNSILIQITAELCDFFSFNFKRPLYFNLAHILKPIHYIIYDHKFFYNNLFCIALSPVDYPSSSKLAVICVENPYHNHLMRLR